MKFYKIVCVFIISSISFQSSEPSTFKNRAQIWAKKTRTRLKKNIQKAKHRFKVAITNDKELKNEANRTLIAMNAGWTSYLIKENETIFDLLAQGPSQYKEVKAMIESLSKKKYQYTSLTETVRNLIAVINEHMPSSYENNKKNPFRLISDACFEAEYTCDKTEACIHNTIDSNSPKRLLVNFLGAMGRFFKLLSNRWEKSKKAEDMILR